MVNHPDHGARYVSNTEGAPPLPPTGGYRGTSRATQLHAASVQQAAAQTETATLDRPRRRHHWLGWAALGTTILFACALTIIAFVGTSSTIFSTTMLVIQLLVLITVVSAVVIRNARKLGVAALTVALLANVATFGSLSALQAVSTGAYAVERSPAQQRNQTFPGVDGYSEYEILSARSYEEEGAAVAEIFTKVREELSREFGVTWTQTGDEHGRLMRNGRGGESMLYSATFPSWTTNEPVRDFDQKLAMMSTASQVFIENGFAYPYSFNTDSDRLPESQMMNFYGGLVPEEQPVWTSVTWESSTSRSTIYLEIWDLSLDTTGDFRDGAEARRTNPGDPVEGFMLSAIAEPLLKEADVDEFTDRMASY